MGRRVLPLLVAGLLFLGVCLEQVYCQGSFVTCPPQEATMTYSDGKGIIERSTSDSSTVKISWIIGYSIRFQYDVTRCYPIGIPQAYVCSSGDEFPITFSFPASNSNPAKLIKVQYDVIISVTSAGVVNSDLCEFYLSVLDTGKPMLQCPSNMTVPGDEQGYTMGTANWTVPVPTDNSGAAITLSTNIGALTPPITYPIGTREITYTAMDQSGNSASCGFNVTVTDAEAPQFVDCPTDIVTTCTTFDQATASVTFDLPNATDNSQVAPNVECFIVGSVVPLNNLGNMVGIGTHNIQCNATDLAQNVNTSCQFVITVKDKQKPNITCPANDTLGTDSGQNFTTVILSEPHGVFENSEVYNITIELEDGNKYAVNDTYQFQLITDAHQVHYVITDGSGNNGTCDQFITVVDLEPPVFEDCPADISTSVPSGQASALITFNLPNATDNSHIEVTVECFEVGNTTILDPSGATVGIGPTYVQCNATDTADLVNSSCTFSILVPDLQAPIYMDCPANFTACTSADLPTASVSFNLPNATDNSMDDVTVECFAQGETQPFNHQGELLGIGAYVIQCNASDPSMQVNSSCSFTITVEDKENPNITCPANLTRNTEYRQYYSSFMLPDPVEAFDNSRVYNITIDIGESSAYSINDTFNFNLTSSPHRLHYIIRDEAGLTDTCDVYLFIEDMEPPQLECPPDQINYTLPGQPNGTANWSAIMHDDNSMQNVNFQESETSGSEFPIGTTTVYVNATDESENIAMCNFTVKITDNEPPAFSNCVNLDFPTSPGLSTSYVTFEEPAAMDNSGGTVTVNCITIEAGGSTLEVGVHSSVCIAIDQDNPLRSLASCVFNITVKDTEAPNITCPGNRTEYTESGKSYARVVLPVEESSVDNSGFIPIITVIVDGMMYNVGDEVLFNVSMSPYVVQYIATDNSTNNASCEFNVTVIDNEDPILMCPRNVEMLVTHGQLFGTPTWPPPEITDNSGEISDVASSHSNGTTMFHINNIETVIYNATDPSGNVGYCNFTVLVIDNVPPLLMCPDNRTEPTEFNSSYANVTWALPTVMDNTPAMVSLTPDMENGTMVNLGDTLTVTYTGTDASGNNGTCHFYVTVIDTERPIIDCPANQTVTTDPGQNFSTFALPPEASSFDNSGVSPNIIIKVGDYIFTVNERAMFSFGMSPHPVWYIATDTAMNNATCGVNITVIDEEAPNITCPENIVNYTGPGLANGTVFWSDPIVTDNTGWANLFGDETSGSSFGIGSHVVKYNATDSSGNTNYCNFTIKIIDGQPPVFESCPNLHFYTSPGLPTAYVTYALPTATDNSGGSVSVNCPSVRFNGMDLPIGLREDVQCFAFENLNPDERLSSVCMFNITVEDNESPNITCPSNRTVYTDPGQNYATVRLPSEVFSIDNSGYTPDITVDVDGQTYSVGNDVKFYLSSMPYLVQYIARDNATNNASCEFNITVIDMEPPNITCPADVYNTTNIGSAKGSGFWPDAMVVENSQQTPTVETNIMSGSMFDVGIHYVHFNATDGSDNTNTCTFNITIEDLEPPQFTDCENITTTSLLNESYAYVQVYQPNATDNSGNVTIECPGSSEGYLRFQIGYNYIPCTAKDMYNNTAICHRTVIVEDNEDPKITCPANQSLYTEMSKNYATVTLSPPEAVSDNSQVFNVSIVIDKWTHFVGDSIKLNLSETPHMLQYIVRDSFQRNATCDILISIKDMEIPDIMCPQNVRNTTLDNLPDGEVFWPLPSVVDNSLLPISPVTDRPPGSLFSIGVHMVHYNATDASGNSNNCSFNVIAVDEYPPQFADCRNFIKGTDNGVASTFVTFFEPNATDNSGGNVTVNCSSGIQSGQILPIGTYGVHCNAYDQFGNEGVCMFDVKVIDDEDPKITCPANRVNDTIPTLDTVLITLENVTHVSDNDGPPTITIIIGVNEYSVGQDVTFNLAMSPHEVIYRASDAAGNNATCNITVTVEDHEKPVISCPPAFVVNTTRDQATGIANWLLPTVTDNSNKVITPTSNVTRGDALPIGDYFVEYTATDDSSNTQTCVFSVTIQDKQPPDLTCADKTVPTQTGQSYALLSSNIPSASDNSMASIIATCTQRGTGGDQVGIAITPIDCEATDPYGNRGTCTFMLTVVDRENPMITCPANTTIGTDAPLGTASFTVPPAATSSDNSNVMSVTISLTGTSVTPGQVLNLPPKPTLYVFVYTVTDTASLVHSCYFGLMVIDDDPPTFSGCPSAFTVYVGSQSENALVKWTPPTATDNLMVVSESPNIQPNTRLSPPGNMVVYTATDSANLSGTCQFMVTVAVLTTGVVRYPVTVVMDMIRGISGSGAAQQVQNLADDLEDLFRTPGNPVAPVIVTISPVRNRVIGNDLIVEMEMTVKTSSLTPLNIEQAFDSFAPLNQFSTGNVALGNTFTIGPGGCTSSRCQNGGLCRPGRAGSHVCDCSAAFTGTDCSIDVDECAVASNSQLCASQGLSCYNALGSFSCNCPFGYWRNGNAGPCSRGKVIRISITILTLNQGAAVFTNDYLVSTSTSYITLRGRVEIAVHNILILLPGYGFVQVRVLSFTSGSIIPNLIVTLDPNSPVTQQNVQDSLNQAIANNNNNLGVNIGAAPQSVNSIEEVCVAGYCMNEGVCSTDTTTFASTCSCASGFTGSRCQTVGATASPTVTPGGGSGVGSGDTLSTEAIIGIAVGGIIILVIIILVVLGVCFLMSRTSSSRTGAMYGRDPYKYHDNHRRHDNGVHNYTRDEMEYRQNSGQFSVPYIASGNEVVPMNRLAKMPRRGEAADYF